MGEIYGNAWTNQFGVSSGPAWQTWSKALANIAPEEIGLAVNSLVNMQSKFPPNLPEFLSLCGVSKERQLALPGKEMAFPHLMNIVCKGDKEAVSKLSPAMYWIYKNLDVFAWRRMATREAQKVFNSLYDRVLQVPENDLESPPALIESKTQRTPEQASKRKRVANSALENLKKMVGHCA